jgi:hypothetical protein
MGKVRIATNDNGETKTVMKQNETAMKRMSAMTNNVQSGFDGV